MEQFQKLEEERRQCIKIWNSEPVRMWFGEQGYFLYEIVDDGNNNFDSEYSKPTKEYPDTPPIPDRLSLADVVEDPFPYPFTGPGKIKGTDRPPYSTWDKLSGSVMYAQDVQGRHLAIKMLKNDDEYKVCQLLKDQPCLQDPDSFPSIVPIFDLLRRETQWFAVMPRWATINLQTFFPTYHLAIKYLISLLTGLAFLHELRIFHRDIHPRNTLVNHISSYPETYVPGTSYHEYLKYLGAFRYAIMDFDHAMVLDEKTYGAKPRFPIEMVMGVFVSPPPYETMHAYVDFDPFKYDVACLGIQLASHFHQIIPDVPLLAPLFDRMLTSDIDKRFTAAEALAFAQTILPTVSPLATFDREPRTVPNYQMVDRWEGLSENFIAEWGSYRENYSSYTMRFQNWLFYKVEDHPSVWYCMYYCRYFLRIVTWLPRSLLHLFSDRYYNNRRYNQ